MATDHSSLLTFTLGAQVSPILHQRHQYKENQALVNGLETVSVGFNPLLLLVLVVKIRLKGLVPLQSPRSERD